MYIVKCVCVWLQPDLEITGESGSRQSSTRTFLREEFLREGNVRRINYTLITPIIPPLPVLVFMPHKDYCNFYEKFILQYEGKYRVDLELLEILETHV